MIPRRFPVVILVGAFFVALTHFGTPGPEDEPGGPPDGSPSPAASPADPDERAKAVALAALDAQRTYYVDNVRFAAGAGGELEELRTADRSVGWGRDVIVVVPAREDAGSLVTVVRAVSSAGRVFCAAEVATEQDAGTWYAAGPTGWTCPPVARGMPGWLTDAEIAWL